MNKTENVVFTNMCMICDGDRVLVQDRRDSAWPGITFPGGHVEMGESFTEAVIREVNEETGLSIRCPKLCGIKNWYSQGERYVVLLYRTDQFSGALRSSEEGEVYWVKLAELPELKLAKDMQNMLRVFTEEHLSELFYRQEWDAWIAELK
ncbi:MAG: 8-oxo-dGTP diphosphatase [Christensenellales bacterium]